MILRLAGPVLVFGGCYSNLQATEALLAEAARRGISPENMVCTGDIIAYGADAAATLRLMREAGIVSVMGNCEAALAEAADDCGCGFAPGSACDELAAQWYAHAAAQVSDDDRRYMAGLPRQVELRIGSKKLRMVHGNVERINAFVFPSAGNLELSRQIFLAECDGVIAGHSGIPFTRRIGEKIWHNAGAIGMPANDGTPRGWFSIIKENTDGFEITSHALTYDFSAAARAMRRHGLPEGYARALETGIWPSHDILPVADRMRTGVALEHSEPAQVVPRVAMEELQTLWVNTGTLCNLSCVSCFMESTPSNDALEYFSLAALRALLAEAPESVKEIGFTGGEPFMNPEMIGLLQAVLETGRRVLVLTNAMRPMQRFSIQLVRMIRTYPGKLSFRVSLDHYLPERHEALRGKGSFAVSLTGLKMLHDAGAKISVSARTPWGETEAMMRGGFGRLFLEHDVELDAGNSDELVLFPEMDTASPAPAVTEPALALPAEKPLMCRTSRMVVRRKRQVELSFTPCTLLPERDLGPEMGRALESVLLDHPHCAQFCVYGGASCAGAPG